MKIARRIPVALCAGTLLAAGALAGTTVDLTAEASRPAANRMVRATVFAEASGSNPAELARRVQVHQAGIGRRQQRALRIQADGPGGRAMDKLE